MSNLIPYKNRNGTTVYKWCYNVGHAGSIEKMGHGAYDILGLQRAFDRSGAYGLTPAMVRPFADTLSTVIYKGDSTFAASVDGAGPVRQGVLGEWLLVGYWNEAVFRTVAADLVASGEYRNSAPVTAILLWMKHRFADPSVKSGS